MHLCRSQVTMAERAEQAAKATEEAALEAAKGLHFQPFDMCAAKRAIDEASHLAVEASMVSYVS